MATASFGDMLVSGDATTRRFAVYRGTGCMMRGKFLPDGSVFVEAGSAVSMCAGLLAACEQATTEPQRPAPPPPPPQAPLVEDPAEDP